MGENKAVFFDRDGVLNDVIIEDDGYVRSPRSLEEFKLKDGIVDLINEVKSLGHLVVVITSQPEIKRGLVSAEAVESMHSLIKEKLNVDDIIVCFHDDEDNCECRKPKPGMILDAVNKLDIDIANSFIVGDTWKDIKAGEAAGCRTILLDTPYNKEVKADFRVDLLSDIPSIIK